VAKYQRKPEFVEAEQFFPDKPRPRGVEEQPCRCADVAQDGRRCELHKPEGRRYGLVHTRHNYRLEINRSEWIVTYPNGEHDVLANYEFKQLYVPV
jgi:hypothetical protein